MYGMLTQECEDLKKLMGEVSSIFTENGLCNIICEQARDKIQLYNWSNPCAQGEVSVL